MMIMMMMHVPVARTYTVFAFVVFFPTHPRLETSTVGEVAERFISPLDVACSHFFRSGNKQSSLMAKNKLCFHCVAGGGGGGIGKININS